MVLLDLCTRPLVPLQLRQGEAFVSLAVLEAPMVAMWVCSAGQALGKSWFLQGLQATHAGKAGRSKSGLRMQVRLDAYTLAAVLPPVQALATCNWNQERLREALDLKL